MKNVRIDDVIVARSDATAAEPLPEGLAKKLYNEPILIRADMVLVDGLRRLAWHRAQGHEVVPVTIASSFLEAIEVLTPLHVGRTVTPLRIWNAVSVLDDYAKAWGREKNNGGWLRAEDGTFTRTAWAGPSGNERQPERSSRILFMRALNCSQHVLQSSIYLYRKAEQGDDMARQLLDQVENHGLGVMAASRAFKAPNGLRGDVTDREEQQRILERGAAGIQAQVHALRKLGHPLTVSTEEIAKAVDELLVARAPLTQLINGLRKILNERENNG